MSKSRPYSRSCCLQWPFKHLPNSIPCCIFHHPMLWHTCQRKTHCSWSRGQDLQRCHFEALGSVMIIRHSICPDRQTSNFAHICRQLSTCFFQMVQRCWIQNRMAKQSRFQRIVLIQCIQRLMRQQNRNFASGFKACRRSVNWCFEHVHLWPVISFQGLSKHILFHMARIKFVVFTWVILRIFFTSFGSTGLGILKKPCSSLSWNGARS